MTKLHSARLTLRPLCPDDFEAVCALAGDARVMATLGGVRSPERVRAWLERELAQLGAYGYCRNVVTRTAAAGPPDEHEPRQLVGLVGLARADFDAGLVPGVEIAWQLAYEHWGQGFATEAARCVIEDAFETHHLAEVIAITSGSNRRSRRVMERLGMQHAPEERFEHPHLAAGDPLRSHVVYRLRKPERV